MKIGDKYLINPKSYKGGWKCDIPANDVIHILEKVPVKYVEGEELCNGKLNSGDIYNWNISYDFFKKHFIPVKIKNWKEELI